MDLLELGKVPISGDNSAGIDAKYEPDYDALQKEIDKMSSATSGGGIDWKRVITLSSDILASKSKDLQVATYLAAGLIQTQALDGLNSGVIVLKDLIENFWENLYPPKKRLRGRINALSWWMDRCIAFFQSYETNALPEEKVQSLRDAIMGLDSSLADKVEDGPIISKLMEYVNRLPVQQAAPSAPAAGTTAPTTTATTAAGTGALPSSGSAGVPSTVAAPKSSADADQAMQAGLDLFLKAADFLRTQDPSNPLSYRLARIAAWFTLDRLPMADGNKTLIPAPDSMIRNVIDNLVAGRQFLDVVQAAESRVTEFIFSLDFSRLSADALEQLGGQFRIASQAVVMETIALIQRLPGLENLTYDNGTPFADKETKAWLKANAPSSDHGGISAGGGGDSEQAEVVTAMGQVQEFLKDKKLAEALGLLNDKLRRGASGRGRMLWSISLARTLSDIGQFALARAYFDQLMSIIDEHKLETWEPDLAWNAMSVAYNGLISEDDPDGREMTRALLNRLVRINPAEALKLVGNK
ncbi:MAG: type VI secretion system protein TssA [Deltaproteobacteria bacterium]|nr:type VI secretion system protein TssA [Deltaproteobacteria bacterium]